MCRPLIANWNLKIADMPEAALKSKDRDLMKYVCPFNGADFVPFSMSYLSGFQAEKRDLEKKDVELAVEQRMQEYSKQLLKNTMKGYTAVQIQHYGDIKELESWNYTLLPVWVITYKYNGKILPFAINGQTGKTYGSLPVSKGKLAILFGIVAVAVFALSLLGGLLLL